VQPRVKGRFIKTVECIKSSNEEDVRAESASPAREESDDSKEPSTQVSSTSAVVDLSDST